MAKALASDAEKEFLTLNCWAVAWIDAVQIQSTTNQESVSFVRIKKEDLVNNDSNLNILLIQFYIPDNSLKIEGFSSFELIRSYTAALFNIINQCLAIVFGGPNEFLF